MDLFLSYSQLPLIVKGNLQNENKILQTYPVLSTRSEGDNVLGSVRPSVRLSVHLSVSALTAEPFDLCFLTLIFGM